MLTNIGTIDRTIRLVIGIALIALVYVGPQTAWGWLGLIPIITAIFGWCPAYRLLGINTCPAAPSEPEAATPPSPEE